MFYERRRRWVLLPLLGSAIGLTLTPLMDAVWVYAPGIDWNAEPLIVRTFGPALESAGWLTFGGEGLPYEVFGKAFFLVYLLMLPVIIRMRPLPIRNRLPASGAVWSWNVLYWATWVGAVADFTSYWGSSAPGIVGDLLFGLGVQFELLAVVAILVSTTVFSIYVWRIRLSDRWIAASLLLVVVCVVPVNVYLTSYLPNSIIVPLSIGWAAVGVILCVRSSLDSPGPPAS